MSMNILKNIFSLIAAGAIICSTSTSCLEKLPKDAFLEENAMLTFSDAEQTLIGIYASFKSSSLYSGALTIAPDIQADLVYAVDGYSNNYGALWQWEIYSTEPVVESVYASLYGIIGRCNFYLSKVENLRKTLTDDDEIDNLDAYTGEIYCARALAYSELVKCFCKAYDNDEKAKTNLGVVIRDNYYSTEVAKRSSLYDSYQFILSDLAKAEALLDADNDTFNSVWLSQAAAYAIHARVALWMGDWENAVKYSSKVIDHENEVFSLADAKSSFTTNAYGEVISEYQYLWQYDSSYETIWKIGFTTTSYGGSLGQPFLGFTRDYTYFYPDYVPANWALNLYSSADRRATAFFETNQTGYSHGLACPLLIKYFGNQSFMSEANIYHMNMPQVLRLSEQYLIRAEAYCNQGQFSKANEDLKTLRAARYASGASGNLTSENWLDEISNERVRELFMEGHRLNDLKRWHRGFERTPQTSTLSKGSSLKVEADNPLFVWPIPRHELESPGTDIKPNDSNR